MDSLLSAAEAVADTASSTLSSVAFSAWSSYHRNRPVEQETDRIPKRPIGSEAEWNSRTSSPLATIPIASSSSSSTLSPGGPSLSEQGGLNSWSSSWLPALRSGETSELRFRGMTKEEIDQLLWDHRTIFTAGTASLISTAASFPFDSLKSRLQVKYYPSIWNCAKAVFREEGIGGFFRGVFIPLITISFVRTSSFSIYVNTKDRLHEAGKLKDKSRLRDVALSGMAGGATSGVIISCGSAPFELVKVQRQLEYLTAVQKGLIGSGSANSSSSTPSSSSAKPTQSAPKFKAQSGFTAAADILKSHGGIKGFYIGFPLHLCRDTLGTALYFGSYDTIRAVVTRNTSPNGSLYGIPGPVVSFLSGSTAGIASWLIVYPVDLVKTNVQQRTLSHHPQQMTGYQLFLDLLKERPPPSKSGFHDTSLKRFLRLYRGLGVSALRSFISHGLTWTIIESLSDKISKRTGKDVMAARA